MSAPLKYKDLTNAQKKFICNGCGGKGGWIKPPDFIFKASCNHHDFKYWLGCTEEDRQKADKDFYEWTREDIKNAKWYVKPYYHIWAFAYFAFVRFGGKKYFHYGDKPKTLDDLTLEMMR